MSSLVLYVALAVLLAATPLLVNPLGLTSRRRALAVWVAAAVVFLGTLIWPPPAPRIARGKRLIDSALPRFQFAERHRTKICATPERIGNAIRQVSPDEIRWLGLLSSIRGLRATGSVDEKPMFDVMQESGFILLADVPSEIVIGSAGEFWRMSAPPPGSDPVRRQLEAARLDVPAFASFEPGTGAPKAVVNFVIEGADFGCQWLTTETRIHAASPEMQRRFASYWRVIQPGSALLRRSWLDAIRQRAEREMGN